MPSSNITWPGGKKIAVAVTVLFEVWSEGKAPSYSVQTTGLKPGTVDHAGVTWASYGGRVGVWRLIRTLDALQVPATFFVNARCAEVYPDAIRQIARSGHDVAGHGYTQDGLLAYQEPAEERALIRKSLDLLGATTGKAPTGWLSPVLAFTPHTTGFLAEAGLRWHADVNYTDVPHIVQTDHGPLVAIPNSEFTDNRVLRSSPQDLVDVYKSTFDFLYRNESKSLLVLALHCHFGGRPTITAAFEQVLSHFRQAPDVWFARHEELADCTIQSRETDDNYRLRYFPT